MSQPESAPQNQNQWDINVVTSDYDENQPWVVIMEEFVHSTFRDWVKSASLQKHRENDVLYAASDSPKSLLKGSERRQVIRAGNIALGEAYRQ
jgi:hypothetical protein